MPRLKATFDEVRAILGRHGFVAEDQNGTSHRKYRGVVDGTVRYVTLAPHGWARVIPPMTLESIIRQSGLPKGLFRK